MYSRSHVSDNIEIRIINVERIEDYLDLSGKLEFINLAKNTQPQVKKLLEILPQSFDSYEINEFYWITGLKVQVQVHKNYELTIYDKHGKYPDDNIKFLDSYFKDHYKEHTEWLEPQEEPDIIIHYYLGIEKEPESFDLKDDSAKRRSLPSEIIESMWREAAVRMELMMVESDDRNAIFSSRNIEFKVVVDFEDGSVRREDITEEEQRMVRKIEADHDIICYYIIQDDGVWPNGGTFARYTLPYVGKYEEEYEMDREDAISRCGTCPAYVVNIDNNTCSEMTEFVFANVGGMIVNAS